MAEISFLDEAIEEVVDAVSYYQLVAPPGTAQRLFAEMKMIAQRVLESPRRWPIEPGNGFRRWRLENFPYSWRYQVNDAGDVLFVAFVQAKRRPGYFKSRSR